MPLRIDLTRFPVDVVDFATSVSSDGGAIVFRRSDHQRKRWAVEDGMEMALSDPGKPWQNGADESFSGKFRDERLSLEWFRTRADVKVVIEQWRRHYNAIRP
ncbi:transposase InsO family protein [Paraburkholderia sp. GAS32]